MMKNQTTVPRWRHATADDLGAVDAIGNGIHLSLPERPEVFAENSIYSSRAVAF
jgi:hypothetical protein